MATRTQSQMITTTLWLLVAVAIGLFVYQDRKNKEALKNKEEKAKLLFTLDSKLDPSKEKQRNTILADISEVTLYNAKAPKGKQTVQLKQEKHGDLRDWMIQSPVKTPADPKEVTRAIGDLVQAKHIEIATTLKKDDKEYAKKVKRYGLQSPQHTVQFVYKGKKHGLQMGGKDSFSGKYFARIDGSNEVLLVESSLFYSLDKKLFDLRRKELFTQRTKDIQTFTMTRSQDQISLARYEEGSPITAGAPKHDHHGHDHHGHNHGQPKSKSLTGWKLTQPVQGPADKQTINLMINSLRYLRAEKFVSEDVKKDSKKFGLDKPDVSIELTLKNKQGKEDKFEIHFAFPAKDAKKAYVAVPVGGPIAQVERNVLKDLSKKVFYFREKRALFASNKRIKQLEFKQGGKSFRLLKIEGRDQQWRVLNPGPQNANNKKANDLLNDLLATKVASFVVENANAATLQQYGLDKPQLHISFFGNSNKEVLEELLLGKNDKSGYYATNTKRQKIFLIKTGDITKLPTQDWQLIQGGKKPAARPAKRTAPSSKPASRQTSVKKSLPRLTIPSPRPVAPTTSRPVAPKAPSSQPAQR
ncbi:MAG: DUF4340 domain-containing protein [Myxococcales bacterium]|nr:DUF4340 domain-containing protein [Myxococcales bacterium]